MLSGPRTLWCPFSGILETGRETMFTLPNVSIGTSFRLIYFITFRLLSTTTPRYCIVLTCLFLTSRNYILTTLHEIKSRSTQSCSSVNAKYENAAKFVFHFSVTVNSKV